MQEVHLKNNYLCFPFRFYQLDWGCRLFLKCCNPLRFRIPSEVNTGLEQHNITITWALEHLNVSYYIGCFLGNFVVNGDFWSDVFRSATLNASQCGGMSAKKKKMHSDVQAPYPRPQKIVEVNYQINTCI